MASRVLAARKPASPGTPASAPHTRAPTTASEVFSATDSTTARAICGPSRECGSRPHRCGSRSRARPRSPAARASPMARASRPRDVPPTTDQVAAAVRATEAAGLWRTARVSSAAPPAAPPAQMRVCSAPQPRWSRHRRRSTPAAARPKAATGWPLRGSPSSRSPIRPAVAPYAKMRSARTVQPAVAPRRTFVQAALDESAETADAGRPGMAVCPHSGSAPWFDVTGDESLLAPGSAVPPAFQPARACRDFRCGGPLPGDSGGTAPDSHRLPLLSP